MDLKQALWNGYGTTKLQLIGWRARLFRNRRFLLSYLAVLHRYIFWSGAQKKSGKNSSIRLKVKRVVIGAFFVCDLRICLLFVFAKGINNRLLRKDFRASQCALWRCSCTPLSNGIEICAGAFLRTECFKYYLKNFLRQI